MKFVHTLFLAVALAGIASRAEAQGRWRYSATVGPYRIDRLAGTPMVPSIGIHRATGQRGLVGGRLSLVRNAGFYGLNALALDFDFGIRGRPQQVEWSATAGPWGLLGGDGDGTPYLVIGAQTTGGVIVWAPNNRIGLLGQVTGMLKLGESSENVTGRAAIGLVMR